MSGSAQPAHRIFISHSHLDNDFVTRLAQDLRRILRDENAVWYDILGLHGGDSWWQKIIEELTARNIFLLLLSPEAMASKWVLREIDTALNEDKRIIPLHCRSCHIRADLKTLQIISFLAPKSYEAAFQELLVALGLSTAQEGLEPKNTVTSHDASGSSLLKQIEIAFEGQDWPDVIRKANFLLKQSPSTASATLYRMQGLALLEEERSQEARQALETALVLVVDRQFRLTLLSDYTRLLSSQGQWAEVLQYAREALRLAPNDPGWLATQQQAQSQLQSRPSNPLQTEKQFRSPAPQVTQSTSIQSASPLVSRVRFRPEAFVALHTLQGHTDEIKSVAFSPNGQTLASGSGDYTIKLWNVQTGQVIRTLEGHTKDVNSVAISPDGKTLASGSEDGTIKLWNMQTGQVLRTLKKLGSVSVYSVTFSPDGQTLCSSEYQTIKLWNVQTGQVYRTIGDHSSSVQSMAFSLDGRTLASCSYKDPVKLWNVQTGQALRTLKGHSDNVYSVAFSPDGQILASCGLDHTARLWNVQTGQMLHILKDQGILYSVAFGPDGQTLASGSSWNGVKLWNVQTGQVIFPLQSGICHSVAFSPDGQTLASGHFNKTIILWGMKE